MEIARLHLTTIPFRHFPSLLIRLQAFSVLELSGSASNLAFLSCGTTASDAKF
jgi:hypothetical protein